jgi:dUTP pyrophosphatase
MIAVYNHGSTPVAIAKGDRVAQGIFYNYLKTDTDAATASRTGGMGSTGK